MYFQRIGSGEPVLFLHGWGCSGVVFLPVARHLKDICCYLPDFNGFGKTPLPNSVWGVEDYAGCVAQFLVDNKLPSLIVVGHSFGCRVALVLAAKYPHLVKRMLLVAPAGLKRFSFKRWLKVSKYKALRGLHSLGLFKSRPLPSGSDDYKACSEELRHIFVKVVNADLSRFARLVRCPVLIVNGTDDTETPLSHAKRLQKLITDCSLVEIPGGHFAFFRDPAAFAKTVEYFAEECK